MEWHQDYDRPGSSLARRLEVVRSRLGEALDTVAPNPAILSLCAGEGRDILPVLKDRPESAGRAVLVELDPTLAARSRRGAQAARLPGVEVRCRDAGAVESFLDVLPVNLLMLCGIFGNIDHPQVKTVIEFIPNLVREGGFVIWTRGESEPDRRPEVRRWFTEAGLEEIAFDGSPEPYGVGLNRVTRPGLPRPTLPARLFSFT